MRKASCLIVGVIGIATLGVATPQAKSPHTTPSIVGKWEIAMKGPQTTSGFTFKKDGTYSRFTTVTRPGEKYSETTTAYGTYRLKGTAMTIHLGSVVFTSGDPRRKRAMEHMTTSVQRSVSLTKDLTGNLAWKDADHAVLTLNPAKGRKEAPVYISIKRKK